ncbi:energy-coupling factor transporter transmembrane protein EcfT [Actinobacteria bacterium YIM 96077]|uniref:Energy-coupling factor transporter transmembrane protein EcfT n=1 Tax=Phytoactinopolyspora halophila TaxID=1981511 RepID=A0A329QFL5_9ACTN|nr:energy-coupling factor transporter transmembrane component T [Phytoactinopolyspora halophila]AYY13690.1 energy-coupling factor transporter transmembrane protein EcfT [Actinobacteria bacterium YIM 96077]RAW11253.1 energy-coupling factor transporter transmembrane protein EcfT [Phytoactinopolyspora halophila]
MNSTMGDLRLPRALHAGAWWLWALGLATAASRTTNPVLLLLLIAAAAYVVAARRGSEPWSRSFVAFLKLGLLVLGIRVGIHMLFVSSPGGSTVLFRLPELTLPEWAAGIKVGGPVTLEATMLALYDGLRLAAILACIGAANALADARRLLRSVPGALYEVGVALVVAMTFAPRLVEDAGRIRRAHQLRGRRLRGVRLISRIGKPVLEGSLERSLDLAAAMDSRGFGRAAAIHPRYRRSSGPLVLTGLIGICIGMYGLLNGGVASGVGPVGLGVGLVLAVSGFVLGGRGSLRTRYRPDPWRLPEWLVVGSGAVVAASFIVAAVRGDPGMDVMVVPLIVPGIPLLAAAGALAALLPAWASPPPPRMATEAPS